ncbi:16S rRNA processing protein RimM [Crossiella equi]|uniref:Ribosome maturation factor RimM n=1 Tax=Crossiella equi TaxID=130796 RepID=A0ABS5AKF8_9PSEU|nr:ribosome maturation factor RimM [Crossiella equi]MBP2477059.1 16S rRNA processing protein RimM [Crossiella equi]
MSTEVVVGRIARSHGIRGELVVDVHTDSPDDRFAVGSVLSGKRRQGAARSLTVSAARPHAGRLLVTFEGVTDRDTADELRGLLLTVRVSELPAITEPDEYYDHQLEGLRAVDLSGAQLGVVREVLHGPAGELLVLDVDGTEVLVPFVHAIVPEVDIAGGRVVLDPPEGLFDQ